MASQKTTSCIQHMYSAWRMEADISHHGTHVADAERSARRPLFAPVHGFAVAQEHEEDKEAQPGGDPLDQRHPRQRHGQRFSKRKEDKKIRYNEIIEASQNVKA